MDADAEREALRRRLYRPGATEEDRLRYAQLLPSEPPAPPTARAATPRRRRAALPFALGAAVLLVLGGGLLVVHGLAAPEVPVVTAQPAAVARRILPTQGVVAPIDGALRPALRVEGNGSAVVALDVTGASFDGGRLAVVLSATDHRPVGWTAAVLETRRDWTSYRRVVAARPARDRFESTRADDMDYRGAPPRWITVQAPADTVWTLTVAFVR